MKDKNYEIDGAIKWRKVSLSLQVWHVFVTPHSLWWRNEYVFVMRLCHLIVWHFGLMSPVMTRIVTIITFYKLTTPGLRRNTLGVWWTWWKSDSSRTQRTKWSGDVPWFHLRSGVRHDDIQCGGMRSGYQGIISRPSHGPLWLSQAPLTARLGLVVKSVFNFFLWLAFWVPTRIMRLRRDEIWFPSITWW